MNTKWRNQYDKAIPIVVGIVLTVFLALSAAYLSNIGDMVDYFNDAGVLHVLRVVPYLIPPYMCLVSLPITAFIYMTWRSFESKQIPIVVVSGIIAACIVSAQSLSLTQTYKTLFAIPFNVVFTCISLVSLGAFIFLILRPAFYAIVANSVNTKNQIESVDRMNVSSGEYKNTLSQSDDLLNINQQNDELETIKTARNSIFGKPVRYLAVFGVIILVWLPYIILYLPGNLLYDMLYQLDQFIGYKPYTNHHPVISTLIYGVVFSLGNAIGGNNVGLLFIIIFQVISLAAVLTFVTAVIEKLNAPRWAVIVSIGFFALCPLFVCYADNAMKDTLFSAVFALYFSLYVLYIKDAAAFTKSKLWMSLLILSAILCGVLRNNGIYVVILSLPFLVFFHSGAKARLKALIPLIVCILMIPALTNVAIFAIGAEKGSLREALSVPFMQSARYVLEHPDDVTEYEMKILDKTFCLDDLENRYDPTLSDGVKRGYNEESSLVDYFQVWGVQGLRHPLSYIDAFGELTYGYWSVQVNPPYGMDIFNNWQQNHLYEEDTSPFNFSFLGSYSLRQDGSEITDFVMHIPFFGFCVQGGTYTWTLLILAVLILFAQKKKYLILLLPCAVMIITVIFGPMNGLIRYFLSVACVFPLLIWSCVAVAQGKMQSKVKEISTKIAS